MHFLIMFVAIVPLAAADNVPFIFPVVCPCGARSFQDPVVGSCRHPKSTIVFGMRYAAGI